MEIIKHVLCPVDDGIQVHESGHASLLAGHQVANVRQRQVLGPAYLLGKQHVFWILLVYLLEICGQCVAYVPMVGQPHQLCSLPQV